MGTKPSGDPGSKEWIMTVEAAATMIHRERLQELLTEKVMEVAALPDHYSGDGFRSFMTEDDGRPVVRLAATHCPVQMDIWQGLRSPAQVGTYPIGLEDIWRHYACANIRSTRSDGSPNPLAMPEPFEDARKRFGRAVILSALLAMNPEIYEAHAEKVLRGDADPSDAYCRARGEVGGIIHKAVGRLALALMAPNRAVVPMTDQNIPKVIKGTRGEYHSGRYHGPCNNLYPQPSIAVMTGLLRFGVNRLPFRDEVAPEGTVRRLLGQYASIVLFDDQPPDDDGEGGVSLLDADRLAWMRRVNDYTDVAEEVVAERYCTYNLTGPNGGGACGKCVEACPSGALPNSSPAPDGTFPERLTRQAHRFWDGCLDFDFGNCCRDRGQKAQLYPEYVCARCEAVCAARGVCRPAADVARINGQA